MDMCVEMFGFVGCWGNVYYGGEDSMIDDFYFWIDQGEEMCVLI